MLLPPATGVFGLGKDSSVLLSNVTDTVLRTCYYAEHIPQTSCELLVVLMLFIWQCSDLKCGECKRRCASQKYCTTTFTQRPFFSEDKFPQHVQVTGYVVGIYQYVRVLC